MNKRPVRRFTEIACVVLPLMAASIGSRVMAAAAVPPTVEGLLYSSMPSESTHHPEMAADGDENTYFRSAYGMSDGDEFLLRLSQPIPVSSLKITTGDPEGQDILSTGFVETSSDGVRFTKAATFNAQGAASKAMAGKLVQDVRIRLNSGSGIPALLIREISLTSPIKISHVQLGSGRGFIDLSEAPDLTVWSQKAEAQMEQSWSDGAALLYTDKFLPPNMVHVVYRTGEGVTGVAATGGGVMTVNSAWCRAHPEDTGLTVHETAHVLQAYAGYNPVWLVEGIADYIRWVKFEPQNFQPRLSPKTATYHDSYQTSATFLAWCEMHYDSALVSKLSKAVRFGTYRSDMFAKYCGKDVDTLWAEFLTAYKADPVHIITPPQAASELPRILPVVIPGTSLPVDLSKIFDTAGITQDGATFSETGGMDSGGASFSANLLGAGQTTQGVTFNIAPTTAANAISSHGNVIALPPTHSSSLWLLGTAVEGPQKAQVFTMTYTDGTTQDLAQNLSDWFQPQNFPGETRAVKMAYRNGSTGEKDARAFYLYSYGFSLPTAKTLKSLTLPQNPYVKIVAVSVVP